MKVAKTCLPLTALLVLATSTVAVAGPQSMLDPYSTIKPPSGRKEEKTPKPVKETPLPSVRASKASPSGDSVKSSSSISSGGSSGDSGTGVVSGSRQIWHGITAVTRGATIGIVEPTKKIGSGLATGTKKLGHTVAVGAKNSGEIMKTAGVKIADGTKATGGIVKQSTAKTTKVVAAPFGFMNRLNPWHKKSDTTPNVKTAENPNSSSGSMGTH